MQEPALFVSAQRARRGDHGRLRLPRDAVPGSYQGSYFFADYAQNWIKRLTFDANGNVNGVFNFEPADGSLDGPYGDIVYLTEGPDGALYYLDLGYSDISGTFGVSKIRRIRYVSGNQAPIAVASANSDVGAGAAGGRLLQRRLVRSRGPGADLLLDVRRRRHLDRRQPQPHLHPAGPYNAAAHRLRRREHDGLDADHDQRRQPADGDDPAPTDGAFFAAGDVISFSGDGTDPEDGTLPAIGIHLEHRLPSRGPRPSRHADHRGQERHVHDPDDRSRLQRQHPLPDHAHGHRLERPDVDTSSVIIWPRKVNLTFDTAPAGLTLYLDGIAKTTPSSTTRWSGSTTRSRPATRLGRHRVHVRLVVRRRRADPHDRRPGAPQTYTATFQASAAPPAIAA